MKEIAVVSGKGGTGKTSFVAAFANLSSSCVIADCDVDAANLHLMLDSMSVEKKQPFYSGYLPQFDKNLCDNCGMCVRKCRFGALALDEAVNFTPILCEGCGVCSDVCPQTAIVLKEKRVGEIISYQTRFGPLIQGKLDIAQSTSGKLVTSVRREARDLADAANIDYLFIDGSPGIGCPVISSLTGVDLAIVITEPTVSGEHDLERILKLCNKLAIPALVIVNKYDLNLDQTRKIKETSERLEAKVVGKIKYDRSFYDAISERKTIVEYFNTTTALEVKKIWQEIENVLT